jgi:hypothetical protein
MSVRLHGRGAVSRDDVSQALMIPKDSADFGPSLAIKGAPKVA